MKPLLFQLDAERAHDLTHHFARKASESSFLRALAKGIYNYQAPGLSQKIWGLTFRNPLGLAAGFDKNGHIPQIMEAVGFGFIEVGSITGNPSTGNPKPRLFRLPRDRALINRMGLNNDGAKTIVKRLKNKQVSIPVGVNIAKTHDPKVMGDLAIHDYIHSFKEAQKIADYITVNISCPNTTEGKTFEDPAALGELLSALAIRNDARVVPTLIKFSSDLTQQHLLQLLEVCEAHQIPGYVACNTSSSRENLETPESELKAIGRGGLSGRPITSKSVRTVRWISKATNGQKPIIGVGGVDSFSTALQMMVAGADLLQIYTGLVYEGPGLIKSINRQLVKELTDLNIDSIHQLMSTTED